MASLRGIRGWEGSEVSGGGRRLSWGLEVALGSKFDVVDVPLGRIEFSGRVMYSLSSDASGTCTKRSSPLQTFGG